MINKQQIKTVNTNLTRTILIRYLEAMTCKHVLYIYSLDAHIQKYTNPSIFTISFK